MLLFDNISSYKLYLASGSPRRKQILEEAGFLFEMMQTKGVEETIPQGMAPVDVAVYLSELKAKVLPRLSKKDIVITADTIVVLNGKIIGKPLSDEHAKKMLKSLSGQTHQVITGVTLTSRSKQVSFYASSDVTFTDLSDDEIAYYVNQHKPLDKAGAYGIQEFIGMIGVTGMNGSFYNVMGLPVALVYKKIRDFIK